jgi:hypothetical protein
MPERLADLPLHQQMQLRDSDPELAMILSGQALPPHLLLFNEPATERFCPPWACFASTWPEVVGWVTVLYGPA